MSKKKEKKFGTFFLEIDGYGEKNANLGSFRLQSDKDKKLGCDPKLIQNRQILRL